LDRRGFRGNAAHFFPLPVEGRALRADFSQHGLFLQLMLAESLFDFQHRAAFRKLAIDVGVNLFVAFARQVFRDVVEGASAIRSFDPEGHFLRRLDVDFLPDARDCFIAEGRDVDDARQAAHNVQPPLRGLEFRFFIVNFFPFKGIKAHGLCLLYFGVIVVVFGNHVTDLGQTHDFEFVADHGFKGIRQSVQKHIVGEIIGNQKMIFRIDGIDDVQLPHARPLFGPKGERICLIKRTAKAGGRSVPDVVHGFIPIETIGVCVLCIQPPRRHQIDKFDALNVAQSV